MSFALTYVVNTFNKLPYLRESMPRLLANVQADEEVVVIDGASTDGTVDYLRDLQSAGKIHQLMSESDRGEAHGWNKGLLAARGELIKVITDDDVFHYPNIGICRDFMLQHRDVDVLAAEGTDSAWNPANQADAGYEPYVARYLRDRQPFAFCGLGLMFRRSSLSLTGLFNPAWRRMDHEFTLRLTHGPARCAWYSGRTWVRITNPLSNTVQHNRRVWWEGRQLDAFYQADTAPARRWLRLLMCLAARFRRSSSTQSAPEHAFSFPLDTESAFAWCEKWLDEVNRISPGKIMVREQDYERPIDWSRGAFGSERAAYATVPLPQDLSVNWTETPCG